MKTRGLLITFILIFVATDYTFACNFPMACDVELSRTLAAGIYKPRDDPIEDESKCKENEVYHIPGKTDYCLPGCMPGCACKPGYVRIDEDECIKLEESGLSCNKSEEITCGRIFCEDICGLDQDPLCKVNFYNCKYSYNCHCKKGYIRVKNGGCIPISQCKTKLYQTPIGFEDY